MAAGPKNPDGEPDFSFLGGDSATNSDSAPDFSEPGEASEVPDFSNFGDTPPEQDAQGSVDVPESATDVPTAVEPEDAGTVAEIPPPPPKKSAARRLKRPAAKAQSGASAKAAPVFAAPVFAEPVSAASEPEPIGDSRAGVPSPQNEESASAPVSLRANAVDNVLPPTDGVSKKTFSIVAGYAAALTLVLLALLAMGRLSGNSSVLESLPDIKPLQDNEFQEVPQDAALPDGHALRLGETQRFGDIVLTPLKVTREQVTFVDSMTGKDANAMVGEPVLKLWFKLENASPNLAFPAWDVDLMSHRTSKGDSTVANSWLMVQQSGETEETQVLNFYHSSDDQLQIADYHSRELINPGESLTSFVASSQDIRQLAQDKIKSYRWRLQIRKGVHASTGHGVTTLVDVNFTPQDVGT